MADYKDLRRRWNALVTQPCRHEAPAVTYCEACCWQALSILCASTPGNTLKEADDDTRCAVCARSLYYEQPASGCVRGTCAMSPLPNRFYAPQRACVEYQQMVLDDGIQHRFLYVWGE
jgi:hypothetical protein